MAPGEGELSSCDTPYSKESQCKADNLRVMHSPVVHHAWRLKSTHTTAIRNQYRSFLIAGKVMDFICADFESFHIPPIQLYMPRLLDFSFPLSPNSVAKCSVCRIPPDLCRVFNHVNRCRQVSRSFRHQNLLRPHLLHRYYRVH